MAQSNKVTIVGTGWDLPEDMNNNHCENWPYIDDIRRNEFSRRHTELRYKLFKIMHIARVHKCDKNVDINNYEKKLINDIKLAGNGDDKYREVMQQLSHYLEKLTELMLVPVYADDIQI